MLRIDSLVAEMVDQVAVLELQMAQTPWSPSMFQEELRLGSYCRVLLSHADVVGYCITRPQLDEWHLLNLGVEESRRRQGWGRRLLLDAKEYARDHGGETLLLEVRGSNKPAQALYAALGFTLIGMRRGYYSGSPADDAWVMRLNLS